MPRGVYKHKKLSEHDPATQARIQANLAKGRHNPKVRAKAIASIRQANGTWEYRFRMSKIMREALDDPSIRAARKQRALKRGPGWKGGNGQPPTRVVKRFARHLLPLGFVREFVIPTRGHGTEHQPPDHYKVDFGNPASMVAVELDGPHHKRPRRIRLDKKKTEVLQALGWKVIRLDHD